MSLRSKRISDLYSYKKGANKTPIWLAYSRWRDKIIAIHIGKGIKAAKELYYKVKNITPNIQKIYTDSNSCYDIAFKELGIDNILEISKGKTKTHMIEAINSSLRDNIARMNRKSKRYSKKEDLLYGTIQLFFHYKTYNGGFFKNKECIGNNK